jgi:hypothetical protein
MRSTQGFVLVPLAAVLAGGFAVPAGAGAPSPDKCEQTIARAAGAYFIQHTAVVRKCEKRRAQGVLGPDVECATDEPMAGELALLAADLQKSIGRSCGGGDKTCGTPDDVSLAEAGWGDVTACPDIDGSGCTGSIADCGDIAECVRCVGESASEQTRGVVVDEFEPAEFGTDSAANKCQVALLRGTTKFMGIAAKALGKCWAARIQGKADGECPDDDEKTAGLIARAEEKKLRYICKACGGDDKSCDGSGDVTPETIGFAAECPSLSVPSGGSCGGAILSLEDVVECVDCVAAFKAECVTRLAAPGAAEYPPECNPNGSTTTTPVSTSTTTTGGGGLCGNGVLDPGEECDPGAGSPNGAFDGSPGGAFCPEGQTCTTACVCEGGATSTTVTPVTTTSTTTEPGKKDKCGNGKFDKGEKCDPSVNGKGDEKCDDEEVCDPESCTCVPEGTTTTTTTLPGACGNGAVDPGEECDASSPSGSFACGTGEICLAECVCGSPTTTTTTLPGGDCGNGTVDPGEECDASSPSGSFACETGEICLAGCVCGSPTSSTTTTTGATATSTTGTPSSTVTTTSAATPTTVPGGSPSFVDFTTGESLDDCGTTYEDTAGTLDLLDLACGGLNIGGGSSTVPEGPTPDGSTSRFTLDCSGDACTLGATTAPGDTFDCTGTGCVFGTPLPIENGGLSTCVANSFAQPATGTLDLGTGALTANVVLSSRVVLTANPAQPCPICRTGSTSGAPCSGSPSSPCTGVCQGSPNEGAACTSTNSSGLSRDCPQPASDVGSSRCYGGTNNGAVCSTGVDCPGGICSVLVGTLAVNLSPLTTGTAEDSAADGLFCPSQSSAGCFGDAECRLIRENGAPAGSLLPIGTPHATTLASVFCIPASGAILIDGAASLPGPGATSLPGTLTLLP